MRSSYKWAIALGLVAAATIGCGDDITNIYNPTAPSVVVPPAPEVHIHNPSCGHCPHDCPDPTPPPRPTPPPVAPPPPPPPPPPPVVTPPPPPPVTICHNGNTREVPASQLERHLGHGDTEGACPPRPPRPPRPPQPPVDPPDRCEDSARNCDDDDSDDDDSSDDDDDRHCGGGRHNHNNGRNDGPEDGNCGHGNDPDHDDRDNPGRGRGR